MTGAGAWSAGFASANVDGMRFYDDILVPRLFDPWAGLLLDELAVAPGQALLDVACGPGTVARQAAARVGLSGRVTACDLSPAMLTIAQAKPPVEGGAEIEYFETPADALPVPDGAYDAATCQQGLQFFPDRTAALREMRRALRPGGRVGIAVWGDIAECPPFDALRRAVSQVLGDEAADLYRSGPWSLADRDEVRGLVEGAGFTDVRVTRPRLPFVFDGGPEQLHATLWAAASIVDRMRALDDAGRAELSAAVHEQAAPLLEDGVIQSYATANVAVAVA